MYIVELRVTKEELMKIIETFENDIDLIEAYPPIVNLYSGRYKVRLKFFKPLKEIIELLQKHGLDKNIVRIYGY